MQESELVATVAVEVRHGGEAVGLAERDVAYERVVLDDGDPGLRVEAGLDAHELEDGPLPRTGPRERALGHVERVERLLEGGVLRDPACPRRCTRGLHSRVPLPRGVLGVGTHVAAVGHHRQRVRGRGGGLDLGTPGAGDEGEDGAAAHGRRGIGDGRSTFGARP